MALPAGDQYFANVVLLMHMDDTELTDYRAKTVTIAGGAARSATESKFGGYSAYFDGTDDYLTLADSADFAFSNGNFTIECWFKQAATGGTYALCAQRTTTTSSYSFAFQITGSTLTFICSTSGTATTHTVTSSYTQETSNWHHAAAVRNGTNLIVFIDGVAGTSVGISTTALADSAAVLSIGADTTGSSNQYNGYIDDLRITKGVARYTANFTPPTVTHPDTYFRISGVVLDESEEPAERTVRVRRLSDDALIGATISDATTGEYAVITLDQTAHYAVCHASAFDPYWSNVSLLMHMNDTELTDEKGKTTTLNGGAARSATQSKFGGYSAAFNGTSSYIALSDSVVFDLSNLFTIEAWVYCTSYAAHNVIVSQSNINTLAEQYFGIDPSGNLFIIVYNGGWTSTYGPKPVPLNEWFHAAVCCNAGVTTVFLNGIPGTSNGTFVGWVSRTTNFLVGASRAPTSGSYAWMNGYIDEVRVTQYVARYKNRFVPPTVPFLSGYTSGASNAKIYTDLTPY
jgi:Concanavalin A-like lectin/glucanases superfamily